MTVRPELVCHRCLLFERVRNCPGGIFLLPPSVSNHDSARIDVISPMAISLFSCERFRICVVSCSALRFAPHPLHAQPEAAAARM
nr:hypothetical protein CFP56_28828 [Quercus suber]